MQPQGKIAKWPTRTTSNRSSWLPARSRRPSGPRSWNEAAGGDTILRARVEALLKAHDNPDSFLKEAAAEFGATIDLSPAEHPLAERPGTLIGPYKLLEQIGEGGMGVVYMADQQAPVRRRVALKIIKAGMDTRQVIARFEAERQALALMDHSNIARVLDAGATDSGRPYFVMELVRGVPITEYCDQNNLSIHETAGTVWASLPGRAACPSKGSHPPRHQTLERAGEHAGRPAGGQSDRLRRGQGDAGSRSPKGRCSPNFSTWSARRRT